tara:strand:- start:3141 stop:6296 length:3156 start_codon:yes stop_codon:yes gene_type:complete
MYLMMETRKKYFSVILKKTFHLLLLISTFFLSPKTISDNNYYVVKEGDTLWSISKKLNVSINNLIELNSFKSFKSGAPIININQKIKLSRSKEDDVSDYCYSEQTFDGVNFSKSLTKRDIVVSCVYVLQRDLDKYVVGEIDSWYMTEKEAQNANGEVGLKLSWNGSKSPITDNKFWNIYFSDVRYAYYFYNLQFLESTRPAITQILLDAALKGDAINADFISKYSTYYFNNTQNNFNSKTDLLNEIIDNLDETPAYFVTNLLSKFPEMNINAREKPAKIDFESNTRYLNKYLLSQLDIAYDEGSVEYYKIRGEVLKHIRNSSSKLLTWHEIALVVNIMYQSMNLDDYETSLEVSSILENRLDLMPSEELGSSREISIYNRFIENIYFEDEYKNTDLILTWILNLTSTLDRLNPYEDYESFIERREYFLEYVENSKDNKLMNNSYVANWYGDIGAIIVDHYSKCDDAESYFIKAFDLYENMPLIDRPGDAYTEVLTLSRCYVEEGNIPKANKFLKMAMQNAILSNYADKDFYVSFITLNQASLYFLEGKHDIAYSYMKISSESIFKNINRLSHTIDPKSISEYIKDYIILYKNLESNGFNMTKLKNYFEIEGIKNRILSNRRLDQIKIDSTKENMKKLKDELLTNKRKIVEYEERISEDFNEKNLSYLEELYSIRTRTMNNMLKKNKDLNLLFNPTYDDYIEITKKLDEESAILYYNLTDSGGNVIIKTKFRTHVLEINESAMKIESNVRKIRNSIEDFNSEYPFKAAYELYTSLFKPLLPYLDGKKNIYLYGSELESLPFGILIDNFDELIDIQNNNQKLISAGWLIKKFSFARIFPLTNKKLNDEYDFKFLGLANPNSFSDLGLPMLNNSEKEIAQIGLSSQSFSKDFLLTNSEASKDNLIKRLSSSYERLVFATHSVPPYWKGVTSEGALVLADEGGDYLLTSTEIVNLEIKSDIVVLSSCSTKEKGSDSIYKSFLVAGANSVMYANWDLETVYAASITDKVFKNILFENNLKHVALQKAAIETLNDYSNPIYAHPAFWGNFSIAYRNL